MTLANGTPVLSAVIGAIALLLPLLSQPRTAGAAPLPYTAVIFDVIVETQPQWAASNGSPAQAYVNGQACGWGFVDATGAAPSGNALVNAVFEVPATCAYPGAPVEFLVNGYWLKDRGGWGVDVGQVSGQRAYTSIHTTLALGPKPQWQGRVYGFPAGATVEARVNGQTCGTATTFHLGALGRMPISGYVLSVAQAAPAPYGTPWCGFEGAQVKFFVNGIPMAQGATWTLGIHSQHLAAP